MRIESVGELGARLRDQRLQLGLSQTELARRVGVSRHTLMRLEHGKAGAEIGLVLKMLRALDLELDVRSARATRPREEETDGTWTPDLAQILDRARGKKP